MTRDDKLRSAFRDLSATVEGQVSPPRPTEILQRAGVQPRPRRDRASKPFPFAGIVGVAALPFVAIGAVLVYPAGAEVLLGGGDEPTPVVETTTDPGPVTPTGAGRPTVSESTTPSPTGTGAQAVAPLVEVTVVLTDERVAGDGCRRLTDRSRFVPEASPISGTIEALLAGPRDDERAVGLSSSLPPGAGTADVDPDTRTVTIDVSDRGVWRDDDCGQAEFREALFRTVAQFDGWTARLSIAGEVVAASPSTEPSPAGERTTPPPDGGPDRDEDETPAPSEREDGD